MTAHTSSMLSAPSSPVIWMVSGPVGVGAGVVVATCVSMAWLSGSWPQMISTSPQLATQPNPVMRSLTPCHRRNGVHGVQMTNNPL